VHEVARRIVFAKPREKHVDALARRRHAQAELEHAVQHWSVRSVHARGEHAPVPRRSHLGPNAVDGVVPTLQGCALDGFGRVLELFHGTRRYGK
jgi:hypothetical protein